MCGRGSVSPITWKRCRVIGNCARTLATSSIGVLSISPPGGSVHRMPRREQRAQDREQQRSAYQQQLVHAPRGDDAAQQEEEGEERGGVAADPLERVAAQRDVQAERHVDAERGPQPREDARRERYERERRRAVQEVVGGERVREEVAVEP